MFKVVAINGSPREGGNTEIMLNAALEPLREAGVETKIIQVGGKNIHGCRGCWACGKAANRKCVFNDDIVNDILEDLFNANAIIFGTPSYYSNMTPELKALIDRAGIVASANGKLFRHKVGAAVIAERRGGGSFIQASIHEMMLMNEMIIPGSTYWNFGFGRNKGEVSQDTEAMANMRNLGENILMLIQKLNA